MTEKHPDPDRSKTTPAPKELRGKWTAPRITAHGSLRHLVRGATGMHGDPGMAGVGKRTK